MSQLLDIYFKSVGRNSVLLLNVPPDRTGRLSRYDVARLTELRAALDDILRNDLCANRLARADNVRGSDPKFAAGNVTDGNLDSYWATDDNQLTGHVEVTLAAPSRINLIDVQEYIPLGERVRHYHVEVRSAGHWQRVAHGSMIGHRNLLRIAPVTADAVRLVIDEAAACPAICRLGAYYSEHIQVHAGSGSLAAHREVTASNVHPSGTSYGPDKAVDDDPQTRWATSDETKECWLEVDLGQVRKFHRLKIMEMAPRITKFQIEFRKTGTEPWQIAFAGQKAGEHFEAEFPSVAARHVRLHILDATFAPTIWEFQLFAPPE